MNPQHSLEEKFRETGGKRAYVQRLFGRIARIYDLLNRLMSFGLDRRWRAFAARRLALSTGEVGLDLGTGDAEHIDLPENSVDGCCSAFTARNLTDIRQGFSEMLRVVRPGGRVVCLEISHPPGKIFGSLFHFYFYRVAPLFGAIIGKAFEEYNYLPNSLTTFPDAPALKAIMEEVGWSNIRFYRLSGGMVAVHVGTKPEEH